MQKGVGKILVDEDLSLQKEARVDMLPRRRPVVLPSLVMTSAARSVRSVAKNGVEA